MVVAFFGSTILSVVALRFLPVWFTPLMFIRVVQQVADGRQVRLYHRWMPIDKISPDLPVAVMASEDGRFLEHHGFDFQTQARSQHHIAADGQERVSLAWPYMVEERTGGLLHRTDRTYVEQGTNNGGLSQLDRDG